VNLTSDMLLFVLATVAIALVGGLGPALVSALLGTALINWFFTPPLHTLSIADTNNALALVVFVTVALLVSSAVHVAARLSEEASDAAALAAGNQMRTALLAAVGHDLRTPLSAAKASVSSLRSRDVGFSDEDRAELLAAADESLDRLTDLVENLLDMSRLQTGALTLALRPTALEEAVARSLHAIGVDPHGVEVEYVEDLPLVLADPGLLERVLANLLTNALRYSPPGAVPEVHFAVDHDRAQIRVVDHGRGIPPADRDRVFQPFQRLGDRDNSTGIGLGLAVARGLSEAMQGSLTPEETPGGGLTMVLCLAIAVDGSMVGPGRREREQT
jgi:two-component system sensor histidine kinase KdpD